MKEQPISRRDFLRGALAAPVIAPLVVHDLRKGGQRGASENHQHTQIPNAIDMQNTAAPNAAEEEKHQDSKANDLTAYIMTGAFAALIGGATAEKIQFGPQTMIGMMTLEAMRMGILKANDTEAFEHDKKEFIASYPPGSLILWPVLVTFAEAAAHLRVENDEIFKSNNAITIATSEVDHDPTHSKEPELGADILEWKNHYESEKKRLIQLAAQNAALSAVLAPIGTTYTSASIANENFRKITPTLSKIHYAKNIINEKEKDAQNQSFDDSPTEFDNMGVIFTNEEKQLKKDAIKKAVEDMNGPDGYVHLSIALSSNLNGAWLIGDPPLFYFMSKHPELLPEVSALGATISEISTIAETYLWLKSTIGDVNFKDFVKDFVGYEIQALDALKQSITNGKLRDVSFNGSKNTSDALFTKLQEYKERTHIDPSFGQDIIDTLEDLPRPLFNFDPINIIDEKRAHLSRILQKLMPGTKQKNKAIELLDEYGTLDIDNFESFITSAKFIAAIQSQDTKTAVLQALRDNRLTETTDNATAILEELLLPRDDADRANSKIMISQLLGLPMTAVAYSQKTAERVIESTIPEFQKASSLAWAEETLHQLATNYKSLKPQQIKRLKSTIRNRIEESLSEDKELCAQLLQKLDETSMPSTKTIKRVQAIRELANEFKTARTKLINGKAQEVFDFMGGIGAEDFSKALQDAILLEEEEKPRHKEKHLLEHQAKDVLWVLGTQLPVVPSLVHTVKRILPKLVGVQEGEAPSDMQIKTMVGVILASEALTSAFADNVAAYLFAEGVLDETFKETYGDSYSEMGGLKKAAHIGALFTAIVAGSITKIGNGPNITMQKIDEAILDEIENLDEGEDLDLNTLMDRINFRDMSLSSTFKNPYALAQTAIVTAILYGNIYRNLPKSE